MIAPPDSLEPPRREPRPGSRRIYVAGTIHPDVRVPMREIALTPTQLLDGRVAANEPVRVYDCSGPWGDPEFFGDVARGLPPLRRPWILARGDVAECDARSQEWTEQCGTAHSKFEIRDSRFPIPRRPLRARPGKTITQLACARAVRQLRPQTPRPD